MFNNIYEKMKLQTEWELWKTPWCYKDPRVICVKKYRRPEPGWENSVGWFQVTVKALWF